MITYQHPRQSVDWLTVDYMRQAYVNAINLSDDPSTQNGAVLKSRPFHGGRFVYGANRLPKGIKISKETIASWPKAKKYKWMCHAERSVIHLAALLGIPTLGATLFCPWFACTDCARAIIDSGIERVVGHQTMRDKLHPTWRAEIEEADTMLDKAGVRRRYLTDTNLFGGDPTYSVLFRDERWIP